MTGWTVMLSGIALTILGIVWALRRAPPPPPCPECERLGYECNRCWGDRPW